jgi:hypothetical protein
MLALIKSLFRVPPPVPTRFVPLDQLTTFQRNSWHRSVPITLTEGKMEALVVFFARSLSRRWSLQDVRCAEDGTPRFLILLEAESEAGLLEIFRTLANSPAAAERLNKR